jgi:hypothetical protein
MPELTQEQWDDIRRAKEKLATQLGVHPEISLIDIGENPEQTSSEVSKDVVLRVHVRSSEATQRLNIPKQIDGIRIVILFGNYQLE